LECYVVLVCSWLLMFQDSISVPSSWETDYQPMLYDIQENQRPELHSRNLKSRIMENTVPCK
jgi:hypothetical protein